MSKKKAEKVEIPKIKDEERVAINTGLFLWATYIPMWYLQQHYGEYAIENYFKESSEAQKKLLKRFGIRDPMNFFILTARNFISMYNSDIELRGDDFEATMNVKRCNEMAHALEWSKSVPETEITRESHCEMCINSRFKLIAKLFGFTYSVNLTEKGCLMTMSKTK